MISSRVLTTGFRTVQIDITTEPDFKAMLSALQKFKEVMEQDVSYTFVERCVVSDLVRELGYQSVL